ncbi:MAG: L,D-transpeptidase family protein [Candidatus Binataceae bacterium]
MLALAALPAVSLGWSEDQFEHRPLYAYPIPTGNDGVVGDLLTYEIQPGDTLLDVGRWYGLTAREVSNANGHIDWWTPPAGKKIVLPTRYVLPDGPRVGIVLNIPEMRLYYYYGAAAGHAKKRRLTPAAYSPSSVVYTFPVGLGRFDWKTPIGDFKVRGKTKEPTWVVPQDIYEEHLERDGEADHVIPGGDPDNPLGHYRLELTLPEYALHGTNVPWGVGMEVSHGCVRLYPEDIKALFEKVRIGTTGRFVYQPVKFGWRGDALYVQVYEDLYGRYPGLWKHAVREVKRLGLTGKVDFYKLEKAVGEKTGIPVYVMPGPSPDAAG